MGAGTLEIDTDTARLLAGLRGVPSPSHVRELPRKFLDPDHLDDDRYPTLTLTVDRLSGVLQVARTSFGLRPETIAAVVKVADMVDIHFDLLAVPTGTPCPSGG